MDQFYSPKILIADDNEEMRLYLQHILKREGWEVVEAIDGEQALQRFQEEPPDLVLLDGVMPKMDGFTVCEEIRALAQGKTVPIIMVTALDDSTSVDLAFEAGASEYITKPVHWNFLLQRVQHLLSASLAESRIANISARMQAIIETAVDGIISTNQSGVVEEFNPAAERIFGYQADEVVGRSFGMLLPEPFRRTLDDYLKNYLKTGQAHLIGNIQEMQGLRKDGSTFPLEFSLSELLLSGKRLFTAIARDISKRKEAEERLQESEQFAHDILNSAHFSMAVLDSAGNIVAVNDEWSSFYSDNKGEADGAGIGVNYLDVCKGVTGPEQPDAVKAAVGIEAIMSSSQSHFEMEYPCHSPQENRWFLMQADPLKSKKGSVLVAHLNITERKEAGEKIRKSEASLQEAQRIAHLGNWDWDIVNNELYWSDEIYRIFGLPPQSFQGTYEAFLASVHPDDREPVKEAVSRALAKSDPYDLIHRIVQPDGTERIVHEQGEIFRDEKGSPTHMVGTVQDVTREQLAEQRLQEYSAGLEQKVLERTAEYEEQKNRAERANQIKSEFLANVTHELKTPLNAIIGFAEILEKEILGHLNEDQTEIVHDIVDSGRDLHQMVNMILQVAHLEKDTGEEIRQHIFYPAKLLTAAVAYCKKKADEKGLQVTLDIAEEVEEIHGDEEKIREVITALLSNSIKFTPPGGQISIMARKGNKQVEVCVTDSGPGVAKEDQDRLFQPFTQLDASFTKKHGGTGMGLYLAKKIVELHGGTIWIKSMAGEGSTFCFTLPEEAQEKSKP